jgi:hypothetical protein
MAVSPGGFLQHKARIMNATQTQTQNKYKYPTPTHNPNINPTITSSAHIQMRLE